MGKISNLTFGQARVKGINKKQWLRAVRISGSLRKYYQTGLTRKERKQETKKTLKREKKIPQIVTRQQIAENFRISNMPPYFISVRALTIDSSVTKKGLLLAIRQTKQRIKKEYGITFAGMSAENTGIERTRIPKNEDKKLQDYRIHTEVFFAFLNGKKDFIKEYTF